MLVDVFAVVEADTLETGETFYKVEWVSKPGVPPFHPYEIHPSEYLHSTEFKDYFITKCLCHFLFRSPSHCHFKLMSFFHF